MTATEELKGLDIGRLATNSDDIRTKTPRDKRLIVNQNRIEEMDRIRKVNKQLDSEKIQEREGSEEHREPLCVMKREVYIIQLSWGGGEDGFKLTFSDGELLSGVYYMADWGEYEESELTKNEADEVYQFYMYGDVSAYQNN